MKNQCPQCNRSFTFWGPLPYRHFSNPIKISGICPNCNCHLISYGNKFVIEYFIGWMAYTAVLLSNSNVFELERNKKFGLLIVAIIIIISGYYRTYKNTKDIYKYVAVCPYPKYINVPKRQSEKELQQIAKNIANYKENQRIKKENAKWWQIWL